jgi:hypothetical protein
VIVPSTDRSPWRTSRLLEVDASLIEQQGFRRLQEIRDSIKLDEG